ncbi:hypothetical protein NPA31_018675 [Aurantimonas sp. MSK8Z-1]|uniref:hypothetical protein n=1 Tax=Mangrovibrevibacter kandeliae TaxID=2968473 RepID=UPI0021191E84|nr:hypothetical protein [Aurantimonas sp. MSK8Z-1]MCW4116988.1 hypothetical protein [Aurantimonas sp. MSK8Z-1]
MALLVALALPVYLFAVARFARLARRNALQFLLSCVVMLLLWIVLALVWPLARPRGVEETLVCLMILGGATLFYLEVWALLSRGYTLGVLLTLLKADRPLAGEDIARLYKGGEGITWIMRHRLSGLIGAGLIARQGEAIALTRPRGLAIARSYGLSIVALGLGRTG